MDDVITDGHAVQIARRIDEHQDKIRLLILQIEQSSHPRARQIARGLQAQCLQPAMASHVIHRMLCDPDLWETGYYGIRHRGASKAAKARTR